MGELGLNKIFGAILAVALGIMGLRELSLIVFEGGGHHEHSEYESKNEWAQKNFAYYVPIADTAAGGDVIEEIYDLGLLLVSADIARGERSFNSKCASCHSIEEGGANGTGPNLYNAMGADKQSRAGFNYSGALGNTEGDWSWERMDAWLENPSRYARGTSMAFAGLKRDDERANVLAYLATYSPDAPAQPEPRPVVEETVDVVEGPTEALTGDADGVEAIVEEAFTAEGDAVLQEAVEEASDVADDVTETVTDAVDTATDGEE